MWRRTAWIGIVLMLASAWGARSPTVIAQDQELQPTIDALETRLAELKTQAAGDVEATSKPPAQDIESSPVPLIPGIELLYYYASLGNYNINYIFGEVRNTTDIPIDGPTIRFTLLDADGNVIEAVRANTLWLVIPPGESMPFSGITELAPGDWDHEEVDVCGGAIKTSFAEDPKYSDTGLELRNVTEEVNKSDALRVTGVVYNGSDAPAERVIVRAAVYRQDGRFVGDISSSIDAAIPPGKTARFAVDQGVEGFSSADPLGRARPGYTYELGVRRDSNVRVSMC